MSSEQNFVDGTSPGLFIFWRDFWEFDRTLAKTEAPTELAQLVIVSRRTLTRARRRLEDNLKEKVTRWISEPSMRGCVCFEVGEHSGRSLRPGVRVWMESVKGPGPGSYTVAFRLSWRAVWRLRKGFERHLGKAGAASH